MLAIAEKIPLSRHWLSGMFQVHDPCLETEVFGLRFLNPVGIAAGYDKNAYAARSLSILGVGHVEVGTITFLPQNGNARPRLFRMTEDNALINSMGFPSAGVDAIIPRLSRLRMRPTPARIGVNIGKGFNTPLEAAIADYRNLLHKLHPFADYITINISSPNTAGLRKLQSKVALRNLLGELTQERTQVCPTTPLLVKIAPDLSLDEIDDILELIVDCGLSGIIATNTTTSRSGLLGTYRDKPGGLSGTPLQDQSTHIIRHIYRQTKGTLPIVGVGGINSIATALDKIRAGASLVQVYTGLVYRGPGLVHAINAGLVKELNSIGVKKVMQLVGTQD